KLIKANGGTFNKTDVDNKFSLFVIHGVKGTNGLTRLQALASGNKRSIIADGYIYFRVPCLDNLARPKWCNRIIVGDDETSAIDSMVCEGDSIAFVTQSEGIKTICVGVGEETKIV
ncbi:hypothetical protein IAQ61_006674, partial [Plenodomus lingam]|uniref:uncharacterized protein n=1 Tax=Leptosphaeria maculans TaxID=5022 RepID=UPI003316F55C